MALVQSQTQISTSPTRRPVLSTRLRKSANYLFVAPMLLYMILTMGYSIFVNLQMSLYDVNVAVQFFGTHQISPLTAIHTDRQRIRLHSVIPNRL